MSQTPRATSRLAVLGIALGAAMPLLSCCRPLLAAERDAQPAVWHRESHFTEVLDDYDCRVYVNWPPRSEEYRSTRLLLYALPNGNSIEQTLGCRPREGLDIRYDIQHVAAQVRRLREVRPDERIVLACVEAKDRAWSNWRPTHDDANRRLATLFATLCRRLAPREAPVTLMAHSGGGSFVLGVIEGSETIPESIDRIAFLDANYAYDAELDAQKLSDWISGDTRRRLIVVAYDDRNIELDGKRVVGPTGGTFRATRRMLDSLAPEGGFVESTVGPFAHYIDSSQQIALWVHPNPENRILHTALVGEMNGVLHAETFGTPQQETWGTFGGPRAYDSLVQPSPQVVPPSPPQVKLPPDPFASRSRDAMGGAALIEQIAALEPKARDEAIVREVLAGNVPQRLRTWHPVESTTIVNGKEVGAVLFVLSDYLGVGSDDDWVRLPMTPMAAQAIADRLGCSLPTRRIVDLVDGAATCRMAPLPLGEPRETLGRFLEHHRMIDARGAAAIGTALVSGIKKDIVLTPLLAERPDRVAIYGWRWPLGKPIQPLNNAHHRGYVDYSHGARLVWGQVLVEGKERPLEELLANPAWCSLVSDEGPLETPRYPND